MLFALVVSWIALEVLIMYLLNMYYNLCVKQSQVVKFISYEDLGAWLTCLAQDSGHVEHSKFSCK